MLVFLCYNSIISYNNIIDINLVPSPEEKRQIYDTAAFLKQFQPFDKLYTSPYRRAITTSRLIGESVGILPEIKEDFKEINTKEMLSKKDWARIVYDRTSCILNRIMAHEGKSNILIIGHRMFFSVWASMIMHNDSFDCWFKNVIEYKHPLYLVKRGSISTIINDRERIKFGLFNYTAYLKDYNI